MKLPVIEELPAKPIIFIGQRAGDPTRIRVKGSRPFVCEGCRHKVMLAPASVSAMRADDIVWCLNCFAVRRDALQSIPAKLVTLPDP